MPPLDFPTLNASLNAVASVLIVAGWVTIHRRAITLHKGCMLAALAVSAIFLGCYLYYHIVIRQGESTRFADRAPDAPGWVALLYLVILVSHIILAVIVTPLALWTAYQGLCGRLAQHVKIARWTMPLWLYVSVTGVVVYVMLYRLY